MLQYRLITRLRRLANVSAMAGPNLTVDPASQVAVMLAYEGRNEPIDFRKIGFRVFSQNDEDGILLCIFSLIGTKNRLFAEIGAGDGMENNTANLAIHHGWHGLQVDNNPANANRARRFYSKIKDTTTYPPQILQIFITSENINRVLEQQGFRGEIDLFSIDIDGTDYWIWEALETVSPRVVVVETPTIWGPDNAKTVPNEPDFVRGSKGRPKDFYGASLLAFVRLGQRKGYHLVGVSKYGTNAFFVRDDLRHLALPEISPQNCFSHPRAREGIRHRLPLVENEPWVDVS